MSEQDGRQASTLPRPPANANKEVWKAYWEVQGQPWRSEPEIDLERQEFLAERRRVTPVVRQDIYPFGNVKLSRADIEWLLATHDNGRGPVDWSHESQREREGLDLRGADLCQVALGGLPLARMQGGLSGGDWLQSTPEQDRMAAVQMEGTIVIQAHLEGAKLNNANLKGANFFRASLEEAELSYADIEGAFLNETNLRGVNLKGSHLKRVNLRSTDLSFANLSKAHLEGSDLTGAMLSDGEKQIGPELADITWENVNLTVMDWSLIKMLGDEYKTRQLIKKDGSEKDVDTIIDEYQSAVRANRQLAIALRDQGVNEDADWFAYRANVLKRRLLLKQAFLPMILRRPEILRWKEQVQKVLLDGEELSEEVQLPRIPRRQSFIPLAILYVLLLVALPLALPTAMLLFGLVKRLLQWVPEERKAMPQRLWFKQMLVILKQKIFAFFAVLLIVIVTGPIAWLVLSIWQALNTDLALWIKVMIIYVMLISLGYGYSIVTVVFIAEKLRRTRGSHSSVSQMFALAVSSEMNVITYYYLTRWADILYEDLVSYGQYAFSLFLDILAGYGYKPGRSLFWYLVVIFGFALAYSMHGMHTFQDALIFSLSSFHGRGFFPSLGNNTPITDPRIVLAALEAVIGLFIEISFIATFTQRFFGR